MSLIIIVLEVVLNEDDGYRSVEVFIIWVGFWCIIKCWSVIGNIVPRLCVMWLFMLPWFLGNCCFSFFLSLSIVSMRLIPFIFAICLYLLFVRMGILLLEVWVHIFKFCSFLWYMGWNNISGWDFFYFFDVLMEWREMGVVIGCKGGETIWFVWMVGRW